MLGADQLNHYSSVHLKLIHLILLNLLARCKLHEYRKLMVDDNRDILIQEA